MLSFGGRPKVQVTKFAFEDFIFVVGSAANSVGTKLEFAAFGSAPDSKPSRASAFCFFFLSTTIVFATVPTHFARTYSSFAPFKNAFFGPEYGRFSLKVTQFCLRTNTKLAYLKNERKMKRTREGSSQTGEDEIFEDDSHDCQKCKLTNSHLIEIDAKLNKPLKLMPELETYKSRVKSLEDEQKSQQEDLQSSQTEITEVKALQNKVAEQQKPIETSLQRVERELAELQRRHIKLECYSRNKRTRTKNANRRTAEEISTK